MDLQSLSDNDLLAKYLLTASSQLESALVKRYRQTQLSPEQALVDWASSRHPGGLAFLKSEFEIKIYKFLIYKFRNKYLAEEALGEMWRRIVALEEYDPTAATCKTFLYKIAINAMLSLLEHDKNQKIKPTTNEEYSDLMESIPGPTSDDPLHATTTNQQESALARCLDKLEGYVKAVILMTLDQMKLQEIHLTLERKDNRKFSYETVKDWKDKGRDALYECMKRSGWTEK